jgi:hypothetical protein
MTRIQAVCLGQTILVTLKEDLPGDGVRRMAETEYAHYIP